MQMKYASHPFFSAGEVFVRKVSFVVGARAEVGEREAGAAVGQGHAGRQDQRGPVIQVGMARTETSG